MLERFISTVCWMMCVRLWTYILIISKIELSTSIISQLIDWFNSNAYQLCIFHWGKWFKMLRWKLPLQLWNGVNLLGVLSATTEDCSHLTPLLLYALLNWGVGWTPLTDKTKDMVLYVTSWVLRGAAMAPSFMVLNISVSAKSHLLHP